MSTQGYDPSTGHMDFSMALREMRKGKSVRRASWPSVVHLRMNGTRLEFFDEGRLVEFNKAPLSDKQLLATDWEEVL